MKTNPPVFRFTPWLVLGVLLLPAWTQADTLTNAMNTVTVRMLCVNPNGDRGTGTQEVVAAEVRERDGTLAAPALRLSRHAFSAYGLNL